MTQSLIVLVFAQLFGSPLLAFPLLSEKSIRLCAFKYPVAQVWGL